MSVPNDEAISAEETSALAYECFLEALNILEADADRQCQLMGNYNVAWELKDDVSRGIWSLKSSAKKLSDNQSREVQALEAALNALPSSILVSATTEQANKLAMNDPCWLPVRKQALKLLTVLGQRSDIAP